jgi:hypothetical protein
VTEGNAWLSVSPMAGSGAATMTVPYDENTSVEERVGSITIETIAKISVTVTVTQDGTEVTLTVLPDSQMVDAPAGSTTFDITSNAGWNVDETISWFNVDPGSGSGNDVLSVNYDANNTGLLRWGTINVTPVGGSPSVTVTVIQQAYPTQTISLPAGWAGLSSYLMPAGTDIDEIFNDIEDNLVIAITGDKFYYPETGVNTIGTWESQSAYKIKTSAAVDLVISGMPEENKTLELINGWNMIPVISECAVDVTELFAPVTGNLTMVKDIAGYGIYWPDMGINSLGTLNPGNAYYVLASNAVSVTFGDCSKEAGENLPGFTGQELWQNLKSICPWQLTHPTPSSHTIAIMPEAIQGFEDGSIIGAFDLNGNCFGIIPLDGKATCISVFGDDNIGAAKDGFAVAEQIFFKLYKPSTGERFDLLPVYDLTLPDANGLFVENGISAIKEFKISTMGINAGTVSKITVYPNPSTGRFIISGIERNATIEIFDVHGQRVQCNINKAGREAEVNLSGMNPGIYMIKILNQGQVNFKKLVLD